MSVAVAVWHFLPWYTWPLLVLGVIALVEIPGALTAVANVLKAIPWQVYAVAAAALAAGVWLQWHDDQIRAEVAADWRAKLEASEKACKAREDAANAAHAKAIAALQLKLDTSLASARAAAAAHAAQLKAERDKRLHAEQLLENERSRNVTPEADVACVLTRGVVRQFTVAAAIANGEQPPVDAGAAGSGPGDVNAPSGVAISQLSRANDDNAAAFASCRGRVAAWESYHATVIKPWIASTLEALDLCIPKGTS